MKHINEYLLSKNKNKARDEKYYVVFAGYSPYIKLKEKYGAEAIMQRNLSSLQYWILPGSKLLDILKPFAEKIKRNKNYATIWEVPEEYNDNIEKFKTEFENSTHYPGEYLKEINYDDII